MDYIDVLTVLFLLWTVFTIIGLIIPSLFRIKTRGRVLAISGASFLIIINLFAFATEKEPWGIVGGSLIIAVAVWSITLIFKKIFSKTATKKITTQKNASDIKNIKSIKDFIKFPKEVYMLDKYTLPEKKIKITYINRDGETTKRDIIHKSLRLSEDKEWYISAFCLLKEETRTFRVDRILELWDGKEKKEPQQYFSDLLPQTPEFKWKQVIDKHQDEIIALMFLAKIDNRFTKKERELVAGYVKHVLGKDIPPDALPGEGYFVYEFRDAAKRINKWPPVKAEHRATLKAYLKALAGKNPDPLAQAVVDSIAGESKPIEVVVPYE